MSIHRSVFYFVADAGSYMIPDCTKPPHTVGGTKT
jgi:hypothetical protein